MKISIEKVKNSLKRIFWLIMKKKKFRKKKILIGIFKSKYDFLLFKFFKNKI